MAHMAVYLRSRPRFYLRASAPLHSSSSISHFSSSSSSSSSTSSSSSDTGDEAPQNTENTRTSSTHAFSDVLSNLKRSDRQQFQQPSRPGFNISQRRQAPPPPPIDLEEIRKNLSAYSQPSSRPFQRSQGQPPPSFEGIYKQMSAMSSEIRGFPGKDTTRKLGIESIRNLMSFNKQPTEGLKSKRPVAMSLESLKETLKSKPKPKQNEESNSQFPHNVFQSELNEKPKKVTDANELCKDYSKEELGERLRNLRPEGVEQGKNWFSLTELNERLIKLRESEQKHSLNPLDELRRTMREVLPSETDNSTYRPNIGLFNHRGTTQDYMLLPPKENLVEQYYHPDNMSSAEKLKLKLKAVRDEFKMSETDCGSPRVQIAQLTTEILHLSKVLHKKDKHSLKGLLAKVQLRKKLLKYLRRTDWDSYCYILSKLGLRDNPGYKQH